MTELGRVMPVAEQERREPDSRRTFEYSLESIVMRVVMRQINTVTALALLMVSQTGSSQSLWQGTRAGMSPSEVLDVLPMAREVPADQRRIDRDGSGTLLQLKSSEFLGRTFDVDFLFHNDRLEHVSLSSSSKSTEQEARWGEFLASMRKHYGAEVDSEHPLSILDSVVWNVGRTDIRVWRDVDDNGVETLLLNFTASPDGLYEADMVWISSRYYIFFYSDCEEDDVFCERAFLRLVRREDCKDFRTGIRAIVRRCSGSDVPCEHLGYRFSADGGQYRMDDTLSQIERDGEMPEEIRRDKAPVRFERISGSCRAVNR